MQRPRAVFANRTTGNSFVNHLALSGHVTNRGAVCGVSVVVCCHNSFARLPPTLEHLARQTSKGAVPWEVIVVDNCSSDETVALAKRLWPSNSPAPLRVLTEPLQGLSNARRKGLIEANYDIVSFVDDDNWVCSDWIFLVEEVMRSDPQIGACGGPSEAVFESSPPAWFSSFSASYAVGTMSVTANDLTWTKGYLWGAGLTIRKRAWQELRDCGFVQRLSDRTGSRLVSGGDMEICRALRLAGWKLYYDPRLNLRHFIPASRLRWDYLRGLRRGFGASSVELDAYAFALKRNRLGVSKTIRENWIFQTLLTLRDLAGCGAMALSAKKRATEGNATALKAESLQGRLSALLRKSFAYDKAIRQVRAASWRKVDSTPIV